MQSRTLLNRVLGNPDPALELFQTLSEIMKCIGDNPNQYTECRNTVYDVPNLDGIGIQSLEINPDRIRFLLWSKLNKLLDNCHASVSNLFECQGVGYQCHTSYKHQEVGLTIVKEITLSRRFSIVNPIV